MKNSKINFDELFGPINATSPVPPGTPLVIQNNNGDGNENHSSNGVWWIIGTIVFSVFAITLFAYYKEQKDEE